MGQALQTNLSFLENAANLIQNHLLPTIGQLSGEDVPDHHGVGVHIHHHVVIERRAFSVLRIQNIL